MNISYNWLRALAPDLEDPPERVAERLAHYGAPVDEVVALAADLGDIVIGRVTEVRPHPNADRLTLCRVVADGERQVVCGAPNVREGGYYPFAPVGAMLPGGMTIRKAKIRGETSEGMLCSERELRLGRDHTGIMELPGEYSPGQPFAAATGLNDVRLVVDVTPNRGDLLSHYGVARELAPGGEAGLVLPAFGVSAGDGGEPVPGLLDAVRFEGAGREAAADGVRILIEDEVGCPRYIGAVVRGVRVDASPPWLAGRLRAAGLRPINNVVDATNYVLHELGQPLHAFDLTRMAGPAVVVRRARAGESLRTLDGETRSLSSNMLVIADAERPAAVAGVMGGEESEVTFETRDILLECALFDPKSIRATARALGLATDASQRFERGVDPESMERAVRRALALIQAVAGGSVAPVVGDVYPAPRPAPVVEVRPARVRQVLGRPFDAEGISALLEPLGFRRVDDAGGLTFRIPGHRWGDVEREIDLVEEIARRHGYDAFPDELGPYRPSAVPDDRMAGLENRIRELLVGRGLLEARTAAFGPATEGDVPLVNPLSTAEGHLRRALLPGLVHRLEYNFARGVRHVRLFEIGTVFLPPAAGGEAPRESTRVAAILTGARTPPHWSGGEQPVDIWDLKALVAELARVVGLGTDAVRPADSDAVTRLGLVVAAAGGRAAEPVELLVPGVGFVLAGDEPPPAGVAGLITPAAVDAPAWAGEIFGLELELVPEMAAPHVPSYEAVPAFPAVERDVALLIPDTTAAATATDAITAAAGPLLAAVSPFDLYRGAEIPTGTRSIAFRLRFRATDRTLTDAEVDAAVERVLGHLREELGIERRG